MKSSGESRQQALREDLGSVVVALYQLLQRLACLPGCMGIGSRFGSVSLTIRMLLGSFVRMSPNLQAYSRAPAVWQQTWMMRPRLRATITTPAARLLTCQLTDIRHPLSLRRYLLRAPALLVCPPSQVTMQVSRVMVNAARRPGPLQRTQPPTRPKAAFPSGLVLPLRVHG